MELDSVATDRCLQVGCFCADKADSVRLGLGRVCEMKMKPLWIINSISLVSLFSGVIYFNEMR